MRGEARSGCGEVGGGFNGNAESDGHQLCRSCSSTQFSIARSSRTVFLALRKKPPLSDGNDGNFTAQDLRYTPTGDLRNRGENNGT
jgi:hypothetical protein